MSSSAPVRRRPVRWVVALLVTLAMLATTTGVVVFAQTGSSGGPVYAPASSVAWAELRLDLPGGQDEQLAELLGHLPGFADPAALDAKVNELLDQVVSQASSGAASWTADIDPWSNRQFSIALLELPAGSAPSASSNPLGSAAPAGSDATPPMVIGLGVKDRSALEARLSSLLTQAPVSTEQYAGATITTLDSASYAVTDEYLLVAPTADDLKQSLDVLAGTQPSLAESAGYASAAGQIPSDRLGAFYFALGALRPLIQSQLSGQPGAQAALDMIAQLPAWISGYVQASGDHLTVAFDMQTPTSFQVPAARETDLASRFPSDTMFYLELRGFGATAHGAVDGVLGQVPDDQKQGLASLERLLGTSLPGFLDPVEDAALGVSFADGMFQGGIAATLSDPEAAQRRLTALLALISLAGGQSAPFDVTRANVAGVPVTTFTFPGDQMMVLGAAIPASISVGIAGDHLYLGLGDFVESALSQDAASSLAADPRFVNASTAAGAPNVGIAFLDIAAIQPVIESMGVADASYTTNVKPWLDALDHLVLSETADANALSTKIQLFVR
jgi:hypothetical protein